MAKNKKTSSNSGGQLAGIGGGFLLLLLLCGAYFLGIDLSSLTETDTTAPPTSRPSTPNNPPVVSQGGGTDWYEVYFTNPTCPPEDERVGGVDERMAEDMLQATTQLDIASFDLDSEPIINALIALEKEGVTVRVVVDNEHTPETTVNRLRRNGISVVVDDRSALMHNKFIIIDGRILWMGSMNFTTNGVYCNNNNLVRFDAAALAQNYTLEFEEMYVDRSFGPRSPENTQTDFTINGVPVESYFSAEGDTSAVVAAEVASAQSEILFMTFSFTQESIGEEMLARAEDGVAIRGVFETTGSETNFSYYPPMLDAGLANLQVRQDGNPRVMHHKVIIIDRQVVIFGSYNFTGSAEDSNDENLLIVHDPEFASYFIEEFETVWGEAKQ